MAFLSSDADQKPFSSDDEPKCYPLCILCPFYSILIKFGTGPRESIIFTDLHVTRSKVKVKHLVLIQRVVQLETICSVTLFKLYLLLIRLDRGAYPREQMVPFLITTNNSHGQIIRTQLCIPYLVRHNVIRDSLDSNPCFYDLILVPT